MTKIKMTLSNRLKELTPEFTAIRRDFHRHPEVGHCEWETSRKIRQYLLSWGFDVYSEIASTGVVARLKKGSSEKCISIRADMDALPIAEANRFAHASSVENTMHACGHDGHMAMALMAAKYLAETQHFNGTVQFIFQPCEEQDGGASDMVKEGLFERFPTDCIIACHNWPEIPAGKIGINFETIMAGCNAFKITIKGRRAHGAMPDESVDPLFTGIQIVNGLQGIMTRMKRPLDPAVMSICKIQCGETYNVISDKAEIEGTVRTFSDNVTDLIEMKMLQIATQVGAAFGAEVKVDFIRQVPPVNNSVQYVRAIKEAALEVLGNESVCLQPPVMPSEDFGVFLRHCPGALFFIGNGCGEHREPGHGPGPCALHNPSYDFNDSILPIGASVFIKTVQNYLS